MTGRTIAKKAMGAVPMIGLCLGTAATVGAPLMGFLWLADLLTQFRFYWIPVLLLLAVFFYWKKRRAAGAVALVAALFSLCSIAAYSFGEMNGADSERSLRVVSYNIRASKRDATEMVDYLKGLEPDVILLMEVKKSWLRKLAALREICPHELAEPRGGAKGIWLLSKYPIREIDVGGLSGDLKSPYVAVTLDTHREPIRFLGNHCAVPISLEGARMRNAQMRQIAEAASASAHPVIAAGDFNCTPFSLTSRSCSTMAVC